MAEDLIQALAVRYDRSVEDIGRMRPEDACALWDETVSPDSASEQADAPGDTTCLAAFRAFVDGVRNLEKVGALLVSTDSGSPSESRILANFRSILATLAGHVHTIPETMGEVAPVVLVDQVFAATWELIRESITERLRKVAWSDPLDRVELSNGLDRLSRAMGELQRCAPAAFAPSVHDGRAGIPAADRAPGDSAEQSAAAVTLPLDDPPHAGGPRKNDEWGRALDSPRPVIGRYRNPNLAIAAIKLITGDTVNIFSLTAEKLVELIHSLEQIEHAIASNEIDDVPLARRRALVEVIRACTDHEVSTTEIDQRHRNLVRAILSTWDSFDDRAVYCRDLIIRIAQGIAWDLSETIRQKASPVSLSAIDPVELAAEILGDGSRGAQLLRHLATCPGRKATFREIAITLDGAKGGAVSRKAETVRQRVVRTRKSLVAKNCSIKLRVIDKSVELVLTGVGGSRAT
jgi:hypothetical protein